MRLVSIAGVCLIATCPARPALAEFAIQVLRTENALSGGSTAVIGWEFRTNETIVVTRLGYYDHAQNGLATMHQIGLFDVATESLIASETIDVGTASPIQGPPVLHSQSTVALGAYRYIDIPDVVLIADRNYTIVGTAMSYADVVPRCNKSQLEPPHVLTTAAEISFIGGRILTAGPQELAFPTTAYEFGDMSATFQFTAIPEPSTFALAGIGSLTFVAFAIRRTIRRRIAR